MTKPIFLASENSAARRLLGNAGITADVKRFDLAEDEAVEGNGAYLLVVFAALAFLYGSAA